MKVRSLLFLFAGISFAILITILTSNLKQDQPETVSTGTIPMPLSTEAASWFTTDQTVIPAGGCLTMSWNAPEAVRVVLRGSNWPEGTQEIVEASGSTTACPSAALNYVPDEPVYYSLTITYSDDRTETREIIITYENPTASPVGFVPIAATEAPQMADGVVEAVFQPFESGWILWRGDINTSFVLFNTMFMMGYTSDNVIVPADGSVISTLAPNAIAPHPKFYDLWEYGWLSKSLLSGLLGMPTYSGIEYSARVFNQTDNSFEMMLPDGTSSVSLQFNDPWLNSILASGHWSVTGIQPTFSPTLTPYPTATNSPIPATYQAFEHGFIVLYEPLNCVYAFADTVDDRPGSILIPDEAGPEGLPHSYYYCLETAELPDNPIDAAPPEGLMLPTGAIGKVWGAYEIIRSTLGYATDSDVHYALPLPPAPPSLNGGGWSIPVVPLPNGTALWCGFRAAASRSCYIE